MPGSSLFSMRGSGVLDVVGREVILENGTILEIVLSLEKVCGLFGFYYSLSMITWCLFPSGPWP